ncbi:lipid-A-disaccharide synthase-related protein [soil metagenome]
MVADARRAAASGALTLRLLVVSNGHGEDAIGARLARELLERGGAASIAALPLVGEGTPYEAVGAEVLGPRRRLPSDGLTLHHPLLAWHDLRAGLVGTTLAHATALRRARPDAVMVVGDVFAQGMASLVPARRVVVQPLVSVRLADGGASVALNRTFMERIRAPERALMRRAAERVYARDDVTAAWLRSRGVAHAVFLGNPMMDGLDGSRLPVPAHARVVALLPGSRSYAHASVRRMLDGVARLGPLHALVAWANGPVPAAHGWSVAPGDGDGVLEVWSRGGAIVWWVRGRFADVLATADAVIGTSGTAQEQAAGRGLPVVSFPVVPAYSEAFLANQRRLLGDALRVVPNDVEAIAAATAEALTDGHHRAVARREGPARMGPAGGTARIAADVAATFAAPVLNPRRSHGAT